MQIILNALYKHILKYKQTVFLYTINKCNLKYMT